jgi:hypothetical protein
MTIGVIFSVNKYQATAVLHPRVAHVAEPGFLPFALLGMKVCR